MIWRTIRGLWSILDPITVNVDVSPDKCILMLDMAARPSTERLHLREVFAEGRRYFMDNVPDGFRMVTTSKTFFNRRRRTEASCMLHVRVSASGENQTSLALRAHIRFTAILYAFWIPLGMIVLLWPIPWPRGLILSIIVLLFSFAWAGLRYGAAFEANEMVFFIRKTFENVPQFRLTELPMTASNVIGGREFDLMWNRFVRQHENLSE